jgi:cbb3-type cytochrome oxidase cytochrome c subunit
LTGDTLLAIDGQVVAGQQAAAEQLLNAAAGGAEHVESVVLTIRRGVPEPHTSHPRLDLFVGESSPHKMSEFACTVCHDGQGSATDFAWASHSPNSESQRKRWRNEHDWFDNPHWNYPMAPRRFVESACLKCHHRVVDLLPSERFPDPPAPKLMRGYELILAYGCFGCHEIDGFLNGRGVGPDLQLEPAIQAGDSGPGPEHAQRRPSNSESAAPSSGLRRPGPSLRDVGQKLDRAFMMDWIRDPQKFQPSTRMPRAFGLWNHLDGTSRQLAEQYEPLEIAGMVAYLQANSVSIQQTSPPPGITASEPAEKIARGRELFQTRGCLACHNHKEFPDAAALRDKYEIVAGPDLSAVAEKLSGEEGRQWLYTFIREPTRYDPRTIMPDLALEPLVQQGEIPVTTDPAGDIAEFLLASSSVGYSADPVSEPSGEVLDRLVLEYLSDAYHVSKAEGYVLRGIPSSMADAVRDAERQLLVSHENGDDADFRLSSEQKLRYVGHKSIVKYGCFGCHDIAGFETAKPIGPALTDWGRIDPHRLAFENIAQYLDGHGSMPVGESTGDAPDSRGRAAPDDDPRSTYYTRQILSGKRSGFAYQKLSEPRSYDYRVVDNKRYNERLRMHQFSFSDEDREAIITFVLGLVAQPPADKYVHTPDRGRAAILDGQVVLDRYQCGSCHILKAEQWRISSPPGTFHDPRDKPTFPFVPHQFTTAQLEASQQPDRAGLLDATLSGMPKLGVDGRPMVFDDYGDDLFDDEQYDPRTLEYAFQFWEPAAIQGHAYQVGGMAFSIWGSQITGKSPSDGGFLAKYLLPHVVRIERCSNPNAVGSQAWSWLPPPLLGEGRKVRTDWLYSYLLEPYAIRPASFMRMPKYNMSADEAAALVDYFAARDHVDFPYEFSDRRSPSYLARAESVYREQGDELTDVRSHQDHTRLGDALRIVSDKNFCVTCHIVGDFQPVTSDRAKGPDLARVYRRLRADYLRRWVAQPASIVPYTPMQVIIPYQSDQDTLGGVSQSLYHGTSVQQLDAVVDLLMNFDVYARGQGGLVAPTDHSAKGR